MRLALAPAGATFVLLSSIGAGGVSNAQPSVVADTAAASAAEDPLAPQPLAERATVRFGIDSRYENLIGVWLADELGEFDKENLDVEFTILPSSETILLLARGDLDASVNSVNAGVMNLVADDLNVRYVFPTAELPPDSQQGVWVRRDALGDDETFQPNDLSGERVLTTTGAEGSTPGFILAEFAETDPRFDPTDIEFPRMAVTDIAPALMNGAASAGFVPTPFWQVVRDSECCVFVDTHLDPAVSHILFGPAMLDGHSEVGLAFLRAVARTQATYLQGDYHADDELVEVIAQVLEQPIEAIVSTPSMVFPPGLEFNSEELIELQDYFFSLDDVLAYDTPLVVDDLWDTSWTDELAGRS